MPKSAVIYPDYYLTGDIPFKKLLLLYDDIYINEFGFRFETAGLHHLGKDQSSLNTEEEKYKEHMQTLEWLEHAGFIKMYSLPEGEFLIKEHDAVLAEDMRAMGKNIKKNLIPVNPDENLENNNTSQSRLVLAGAVRTTNRMMFDMNDIRIRIDALRLALENKGTDFIPIINSLNSYKQRGSSDLVFNFILKKIPVPDECVSWEQIIDFKYDDDVKRKYYALINWINQMTRSDMPLSHIVDKYNQLYSEYCRQYSLHKINSNLTTIELLVFAGIDLISSFAQQNYLSAFKDVLSIRKQQLSLLKSEKEIEGRELAYIHSLSTEFA